MHSEWECFSDVFVLHRTKCKPMDFEWERFSDERERERESVRRQYSAPSSYIYVNISDFLSRPPQKLKRTCSTECVFLRQLSCSTERNKREREREGERGASEGACADSTAHPLVIYMSIFPFLHF